MNDEVKNPWQIRKGVVVVDIETNWADDWSEQGKRNRDFKVGVIFSYDDNKYHKFKNPTKVVEFLNKAKAIVSYNGEGFDFLVLEKYGLEIKKYKDRWIPRHVKSFDIMHTIQEKRPKKHQNKKYPRLDEMIFQHYGSNKTSYYQNDLKQIMKHCSEDVKYTKMLYEEKIWKVPVIERVSKKRRWDNNYDDDVSGVVWDGENWTYIADFGRPIERVTISLEDTILCPICKENKLSLYEVARKHISEVKCSKCSAVVTFSPANEIISVQSKEEYKSSICSNCGKKLEESGYEHYGYGAGHGFLSQGRSICPACGKGCYEWENDDTPGFRDHWKGNCCFCKKDIGEWCIEQYKKSNLKIKKR